MSARAPVTWRLEDGLLHVTVVGPYSFNLHVRPAILAALRDPAFGPGCPLVYDMRAVGSFASTAEMRRRSAWIASLRADGLRACAVVVPEEAVTLMEGQSGVPVFEAMGVPIRIFQCMGLAQDWARTHSLRLLSSPGVVRS